MNEKEQMKLDMVKHLALRLVADQPDLTMEQALSTVINSETYQRLQRDATGFYYQSPGYVYSFLDNELKRREWLNLQTINSPNNYYALQLGASFPL